MNLKQRIPQAAIIALLAGSGIGGLGGAVSGAAVATERDRQDTVSREEYQRVCDKAEAIAMLYQAERQLNVQLTQKHEVAMRVLGVKIRPHSKDRLP